MEPEAFDKFARSIQTDGVDAAFATLKQTFEEVKDYHQLFDALLLEARFQIGLPLVMAPGPIDRPEVDQKAYEERVVVACRQVGQLFIDAGDIGTAYQYYSMIGELEPLKKAIENFEPTDDESAEAVVEVAIARGVHPERGMKILIERCGTCQAITAAEGILGQQVGASVREGCLKLLVRTLHKELVERLAHEIKEREGSAPAAVSVPILIKGRDWLFADDNYHIDTSHLNSVVRLARYLPKCEETFLAIQLCEYGRRLSDRYRYPEPAPFEDVYTDSTIFFKAIAGMETLKGLEHFKKKAEAIDINEGGEISWQVYIDLLTMVGKKADAIRFAADKLNDRFPPGLSTPINQLCQSANDFTSMADLARKRNDLLSFAAGLIQKARSASEGS